MTDIERWGAARRLLCVRLDTLGDVLMTTPAIRALRDAAPGRSITLLTSRSGAEVARLVPEVDDVLPYEVPWMRASAPGAAVDPIVRSLRERRFDAAVIFTVFSQSAWPGALLCHAAGIPLRLAHLREKPYQVLTDWVPEPEPERLVRHEVRRQLDLVAAVGCRTEDERLSLRVPPDAEASADRLLEEAGVSDDRPWAVLHPGASAPSRQYPWEGYAEVGTMLSRDHGWQVVLTGDADDVEVVERVRARIPSATGSLAGRASLAELAAVLRRAPVLISNNTGPVHVAAAVGTPVVDVYAYTNPQHTPWGVPSAVLTEDVPCRNCSSSVCLTGHHHCVRGVTPRRIVDAALDVARLSRDWPGPGGRSPRREPRSRSSARTARG